MADCILRRRNKHAVSWLGPALALAVAASGVCASGQTRNSKTKAAAKRPEVSTPAVAAGAASASAKVTAVRFWSLGEVTRVAVEVSSEFKFKSDHIHNPERMFFDIEGAKPALSDQHIHTIAVGDALLKQIRVAETVRGVTRVVLDVEEGVTETTSQLSNPGRLIVELKRRELKPGDRPTPSEVSVSGGRKPIEPARIEPSPIEPEAAEPRHTPTESEVVSARPVTPPTPPPPAKAPPLAKAPRRKFVPPPPRLAAAVREAPSATLPATLIAASLNPPLLAMFIKPPVLSGSFKLPPLPPPPPLLPAGAAPAIAAKTAKTLAATSETAEPLPAKLRPDGDRSLTRVLGLKLGRVVLDPGHGGHDMGTHGPSGLSEKDVVLDVSQRLGALIEDRLGSEVIYTRGDDTFIPLEERTAIANQHKADLFLSIHANSSPYRSAAGVETYILNFTTSKTALDIAARENASSERGIFDLKDALTKIALKDKIDESREFAVRLQTALWSISAKNNAAARDRGVKKAPFVVLIGAQMPSVLAEIGFLTNSGDEALMRKPEQRQKIAEALYKGIAAYADSLSHFQVAKRD